MRRAAVRICFLTTMLALAADAFAIPPAPIYDPVGPRVRGATPQMTKLIREGISRSDTFERLVATLQQYRVIVYVQETRELPPGVDGRLAVSSSQGSFRYLRAQVLSGLSAAETIAIVAHELQHAVEVAQHEDVRDSASLLALYVRIGIQTGHGQFDTLAAKDTGKRVRAELG